MIEVIEPRCEAAREPRPDAEVEGKQTSHATPPRTAGQPETGADGVIEVIEPRRKATMEPRPCWAPKSTHHNIWI